MWLCVYLWITMWEGSKLYDVFLSFHAFSLLMNLYRIFSYFLIVRWIIRGFLTALRSWDNSSIRTTRQKLINSSRLQKDGGMVWNVKFDTFLLRKETRRSLVGHARYWEKLAGDVTSSKRNVSGRWQRTDDHHAATALYLGRVFPPSSADHFRFL